MRYIHEQWRTPRTAKEAGCGLMGGWRRIGFNLKEGWDDRVNGGSETGLGEDFGSELECGLHVALDFEFALHEGVLGVEFACEEVGGVVVEHVEGGVSLALLTVLDGAVAIFEIDGPDGGGLALGGGDFEMVDISDLLDCL